MRPHTIRTTKLLAAAVTLTACADRTPSPAPPPTPTATVVAEWSPPPAPTAAAAVEPSSTPPVAEAAPPAEVAGAVEPPARRPSQALKDLAGELAYTDHDAVLARRAHFRPLCDARGYPLVGNLIRKGPTYQPSQFCKEIREGRGR
jgi:hypothetical protein